MKKGASTSHCLATTREVQYNLFGCPAMRLIGIEAQARTCIPLVVAHIGLMHPGNLTYCMSIKIQIQKLKRCAVVERKQ